MREIEKKVISFICVVTAVVFMCGINTNAASNPYGGGYSNCTWSAWQLCYEATGHALPAWSNANTWLNSAKNAGYSTGTTPKANSVAVWYDGGLGHVGWVSSVNGSQIYVKEGGYDGGYHEGWLPGSGYRNGTQYIAGYIYIGTTDTNGPACSDFHVGEFREGAFTVLSKVTDSSGVKSVKYAIWTEKNGQDDIVWYDGVCTDNNNYYWARINFSSHNYEMGKYIIHMYAYDNNDNLTNPGISYTFPETGPSITDIVVSNVSASGYTITCKVKNSNSDAGVWKVQFPTWTLKNGQDDIASDWGKNTKVRGTINKDTVTFVVKTSDHNNETGVYRTHIYAYDVFGVYSVVHVPDVNVHNHVTEIIKGTPASCTKSGLTDGEKCTICNEIIKPQEEIKAEGHLEEIIPAVPATCTASGTSEGKKCSKCGEIIVKPTVVPAKGHTVVIDKGTPATKTSIGLTEGSHCSVCNVTIKRQQIIPALGDKESTDPSPTEPAPTKPSNDNGIGTISSDGKTLTDTDNVKYYVSGKLKNKDLKKNLKIADKKSGGKYKITKVIKKNGKVVGGNVTYMAPYNRNCTKATAGATVKLGGVSFKITALNASAFKDCKKLTTFKAGGNMLTIGKNAFNGCANLKSVTITSTKLKNIGTNAFKGTTAKTKFKVPKSKLSKYSKMIYKAGANKKAKITK